MKKLLLMLLSALLAAVLLPPAEAQTRVVITYPASLSAQPLNGRVFLYVAPPEPPGTRVRRFRRGSGEPRFAIGDQVGSQQFFGKDVLAWKPGQPAVIDASIYGYPVTSLAKLPVGDYTVQALFNRYTTSHRADGHTLLLPRDEARKGRRGLSDVNCRVPFFAFSVPFFAEIGE